MTREIEAIFENGVLKPVEPLPFAEKERVAVRVSSISGPASQPGWRTEETKWIGENAHLYKGEYIAVQGSELVSHGHDLKAVSEDARRKGAEHPLYYHVPEHLGEPTIGGLW